MMRRLLVNGNNLAYLLALFLASLLPRRPALHVGRRIGRLQHRRRGARARPYEANMRSLLGASPEQAAAWMGRLFELGACHDLEAFLYARVTGEDIGALIEVRGMDRLRSALARGRGAILYSGHVRGDYTLFAALGLLGLGPHIVSRRLGAVVRREGIDRWFYRRREALVARRMGCEFTWMAPDNPAAAVQAARALRRNEVVVLEIDNSPARQQVEVTFLGRRVRFPPGPVLLAQATGAPLLDFYLHRDDRWIPQVAELGPPFHPSEDVAAAVQHCASRLEAKIREHPESWATWLFPRWHLWKDLG
jgi:lauroyl/myristoyl acyltransferase